MLFLQIVFSLFLSFFLPSRAISSVSLFSSVFLFLLQFCFSSPVEPAAANLSVSSVLSPFPGSRINSEFFPLFPECSWEFWNRKQTVTSITGFSDKANQLKLSCCSLSVNYFDPVILLRTYFLFCGILVWFYVSLPSNTFFHERVKLIAVSRTNDNSKFIILFFCQTRCLLYLWFTFQNVEKTRRMDT